MTLLPDDTAPPNVTAAAAAATCPLCKRPNQCAIAAGRPPQSCWCMAATIAPEALAALPAAERGKACICAACGQPI